MDGLLAFSFIIRAAANAILLLVAWSYLGILCKAYLNIVHFRIFFSITRKCLAFSKLSVICMDLEKKSIF
jgi:hypothetical protein